MKLRNLLISATAAWALSTSAQADYVSLVTGADMQGMEVTVFFEDQSSDTAIWEIYSEDESVDYLEGFSGGAEGASWSLYQQGDSMGNFVNGQMLGLWTLTNTSSNLAITSVLINALVANIVFDTAVGDDSGNGSGPGREFIASNGASGAFSQQVEDELYGSLTITGFSLNSGNDFGFFTDTDRVQVSTPSILALFSFGAFALLRRRRKI